MKMSNAIKSVLSRLSEIPTLQKFPIIKEIKKKKLTYLKTNALRDLVNAVQNIEKKGIQGDIYEAGCALGGSSILMAKYKNKDRNLYCFDVFGMIPPPSENDENDVHSRYEVIKSGKSEGINGDRYYGYEDDLYNKVVQNFQQFDLELSENNIHLVKGLFEDTLHPKNPIALAHVDCDWYNSVMVCLEQIFPKLVSGGFLVIDDYYAYSGCKKAVDDYFKTQRKDSYRFVKKTRLFIEKV
jgi:SAM-dependent methyltransferase